MEFKAIVSRYLKRFNTLDVQTDLPACDPGTKLIVVIPCYFEYHWQRTLESLQVCDSIDGIVEVILLINNASDAPLRIRNHHSGIYQLARIWAGNNSTANLKFHAIWVHDLPPKQAGVGLARKVGMDIALTRFADINHDGIIATTDADCSFSANYFSEIVNRFDEGANVAHLNYEHDLSEITNIHHENSILEYELFLRYYVHGLRYSGYKHAFHTVGSCMVVRASTYALYGGMNTRKAGEDFYFLHKLAKDHSIEYISGASVYPSPRVSNRVPFGTGKAMLERLQDPETEQKTYPAQIFEWIKEMVEGLESAAEISSFQDWISCIPEVLRPFYNEDKWIEKVETIIKESSDLANFKKRWEREWDGLHMLQLVHFAQEKLRVKSVEEESKTLLEMLGETETGELDLEQLLDRFRALDKRSDGVYLNK